MPSQIEQLEARTFLTVVSLSMSLAEIAETSTTPTVFTVRRDNTIGDLVVRYRVGGSATPADLVSPLSGFVAIPAGSSSATISVQPRNDGLSETHETLTIQLLHPDGSGYTLGQYDQGTLRIRNAGTTLGTYRTVGPGKTYATPSAAIAAASPGDTIDIWPDSDGVYTNDTASVSKSNLTIRGIGLGRVKVHADPATYLPNKKGIWVFNQGYSGFTVENFEFQGARVATADGGNGAGLRLQGDNWIVRNCRFYNNEMGLLASGSATSSVLIEHSEFVHNGLNSSTGNNHNVYIGSALGQFTFRYNYSSDSTIGHLVKSRARINYILYNRLFGVGDESYEINLPEGGKSYIIGNIIRQSPGSDNSTIIDYASEKAPLAGDFLYVVNNTVINDRTGGIYVRGMRLPAGFNVTVKNNIFAGPVTSYISMNAGTLTASNNITGTVAAMKFVNPAVYNYHLTSTSPAVNAGANPGVSAEQGYSLSPAQEYVADTAWQARPAVGALDAGGYELPVTPATPAAPVLLAASDSGVPGDNRTSDNTPTLAINVAAPFFRLYVDGAASGGIRAAASSVTLPAVPDGTHTVAITAMDAAGNVSAASPACTLKIDTVAPAAPAIVINSGEVQRSMIKSIAVSYAEAVALSAGALDLKLQNGAAVPNTTVRISNPSGDQKTYVLTFSGAAVTGTSLADGLYRLFARASLVHDLAGNAQAADRSVAFHRFFGDSDGDRDVDSADKSLFQAALGSTASTPAYKWWFDFDSDRDVDAVDSGQFNARLGRAI